jgi:hypothetical protein
LTESQRKLLGFLLEDKPADVVRTEHIARSSLYSQRREIQLRLTMAGLAAAA